MTETCLNESLHDVLAKFLPYRLGVRIIPRQTRLEDHRNSSLNSWCETGDSGLPVFDRLRREARSEVRVENETLKDSKFSREFLMS